MMIDKKAEPKLMDTGTIFAEMPVCRWCTQPIERGHPKLARWYEAVGPWVHSHSKSVYCYGPR